MISNFVFEEARVTGNRLSLPKQVGLDLGGEEEKQNNSHYSYTYSTLPASHAAEMCSFIERVPVVIIVYGGV